MTYLERIMNGEDLGIVPENEQTPELCLEAVRCQSLNLRFVARKTEEMCRTAVMQEGWNLRYVPRNFRTYGLCMTAVQKSGKGSDALAALVGEPEGFWYSALPWVPAKHKDEAMIIAALNVYGQALEYIEKTKRTPKFCEIAVKEDPVALRYVPLQLKTFEMIKEAVSRCGRTLRYVPFRYRTPEICEIAVEQDYTAIFEVPLKLRSKKMCAYVIRKDPMALQFAPRKMLNEKFCLKVLRQRGEAIKYIPRFKVTEKMCETAVKQSPFALKGVPVFMKSPGLCRMALENAGDDAERVKKLFPKNYLDIDGNLVSDEQLEKSFLALQECKKTILENEKNRNKKSVDEQGKDNGEKINDANQKKTCDKNK